MVTPLPPLSNASYSHAVGLTLGTVEHLRRLADSEPLQVWEALGGAWAEAILAMTMLAEEAGPAAAFPESQYTAIMMIQEYFAAHGNLDEMLRSLQQRLRESDSVDCVQ
jgi:hypothetical protein